MKEFLPNEEAEEPPKRKINFKVNKNYIRSFKRSDHVQQLNRSIEGTYHTLLKRIKKSYAKLPEEKNRLVYERNRTPDPDAIIAMYDFAAPGLILRLECDILCKYWIRYSIGTCPIKVELTKYLREHLYEFNSKIEEIGNVDDFYRSVISCQSEPNLKTLPYIQ